MTPIETRALHMAILAAMLGKPLEPAANVLVAAKLGEKIP